MYLITAQQLGCFSVHPKVKGTTERETGFKFVTEWAGKKFFYHLYIDGPRLSQTSKA
jgi:hypothetical protein